MITVTIWHNVAVDGQGHPTGMLDGYQPGDPMVRVFTYQAATASPPQEIAEEAFGICNDHPRDTQGEELARRYYGRELRSLSFPETPGVAAGGVEVCDNLCGDRACYERNTTSLADTSRARMSLPSRVRGIERARDLLGGRPEIRLRTVWAGTVCADGGVPVSPRLA
jgi:hypothetical protein